MMNIVLACLPLILPYNDTHTNTGYISPHDSSDVVFPRLTVNPKRDVVGTENTTAGTRELEGLPGYFIHVPSQALGKSRVPLVLLLHGGGRHGLIEMEKFRVFADKYGMILLTASSLTPGQWDVIGHVASQPANWQSTEKGDKALGYQPRDVSRLDSALKYVLRTQAIDPARIALLGFSDGGSYSFFLGRSNLDVFSRIAPLSGLIPFYAEGPVNPATQFFISGGLGERDIIKQVVRMAALLRADGHAVKTQVGLRSHVDYLEDEDFVWNWLQQSWNDPTITTAIVPPGKAESALLTTDALEKLTEFWSAFAQLPTAIRDKARMEHQREVWIRIGTEWTTTPMMDLSPLAAEYREISESLQRVGITADQADAYRRALVEAYYTMRAGLDGDATDSTAILAKSIRFTPIDVHSRLAKNIEFLKTNKVAFQQLAQKGILRLQ